MNELFKEFLMGFITLLGTALSLFVIKLISAKIDSIISVTNDDRKRQFLYWVENDVIVKCINATNQTYVQSLKDSGKFDKEAQVEAMNKTVSSIMEILTETNSTLLSEYVGDVTTWIKTHVEDYILNSKK